MNPDNKHRFLSLYATCQLVTERRVDMIAISLYVYHYFSHLSSLSLYFLIMPLGFSLPVTSDYVAASFVL